MTPPPAAATRRRGRLRIGTSGWEYPHWRGVFYPRGLRRTDWFDHYARHFDTVEVNATFYRLPEVHVFESWRAHAPPGFCYALKFSRYGSHMKRLLEAEATVPHFLERAVALGPRLGPVLVQLPPRFRADPQRLDAFLSVWPRRPRRAVEFRDPGWLEEPVYRVLRRHRAALCIHDAIDAHPRELTARWAYLRFHGPRAYSPQRLGAEARRIRGWLAAGLDVYAYFNNDAGGAAVADALRLRRLVESERAGRVGTGLASRIAGNDTRTES